MWSKGKHTIPCVNSALKFQKIIRRNIILLIFSLIQFSAFAQNEPNPILPDTLFLAQGNSIELYNDDVAFVQLGNTRYTFDWEYEVGNTDSRKWYWSGDQLGLFNLKFKCYLDGVLVDEESTIIKVVEKVSGEDFYMLAVGNSLTTGGFGFQYEQISTDLDFTLKTTGTQGNTLKHEGHSGWEFITFLGSESPFYFDGSIDPARYISANGLVTPAVVKISLGINDCFLSQSMDYISSNADLLISAFLESFPQTLVLIAMPTLCENSGTGWLAAYGTLDNYERYQLRIREFWEYLLSTYGSGSGPDRVHVSYDGLSIDRDVGYPKDGSGNHTNGVHPNPYGYHQLSRGFSNVLNYYADDLPDPVDTEAPSVPTGLTIVGTSTSSLSISWNPSTDNVNVAGYKIYVGGALHGSTDSTTYTISGLTSGTSYSVSVSAFDDTSNESDLSTPLVAKTDISNDTIPPSIPAGLQMVGATVSSLSILWNPSTDNVGVAGYKVFVNGAIHDSTSSTTYIITSLEEGTSYSVTVSAFDEASNESDRSPPVVGQTEIPNDTTPPSIPNGLNATNPTNTTIHLTWNQSSDNIGVAGYGVFLNESRIDETTNTAYTFSELAPATLYSLSVSAFDESGNESVPSDNIQVSTSDSIPPQILPLPQVSILQISQINGLIETKSNLSSYGHSELVSFGILVQSSGGSLDDASIYYSDPAESVVSNGKREKNNLQLFYNYSDQAGDFVSELSGSDDKADLKIDPGGNTKWLRGQGLEILGKSILYNKEVGVSLMNAFKTTEEISVENWLKPSQLEQLSPSNILGIVEDSAHQFFIQQHLSDEDNYEYGFRLSTSNTDHFGNPEISTESKIRTSELQHVLYTRNVQGNEKIYLNGELVKTSSRSGSFSTQTNSTQLELCNLHYRDAPWMGTLFLTAIYNKALDASQANINYMAGIGQIEYGNEINDLVPGNTYYLYPFAETKLGMIIGDSISVKIEKDDYPAQIDSIIFEIHPNPSDGRFTVYIDESTTFTEPANLQIANLSGQIVYSQKIAGLDAFYAKEIVLNLSNQLTSGFYSIMMFSGAKASARKLLIQQ